MRIGEAPDEIWSLCGRPDEMVRHLVEYEQVGVDEIVMVFDAVTPEDIRRETERFHEQVLLPYRDASRAVVR